MKLEFPRFAAAALRTATAKPEDTDGPLATVAADRTAAEALLPAAMARRTDALLDGDDALDAAEADLAAIHSQIARCNEREAALLARRDQLAEEAAARTVRAKLDAYRAVVAEAPGILQAVERQEAALAVNLRKLAALERAHDVAHALAERHPELGETIEGPFEKTHFRAAKMATRTEVRWTYPNRQWATTWTDEGSEIEQPEPHAWGVVDDRGRPIKEPSVRETRTHDVVLEPMERIEPPHRACILPATALGKSPHWDAAALRVALDDYERILADITPSKRSAN